MAFTKITGPGIHTLSNIMTHNVKSSGIITAVNGNLTGWLAVGSTASFGGDVSIGGTLTYDDVTNVEAVGIITAKAGIHVGAAGTVLHAINDSGVAKVGIGTTIPTAKLEISHPTHTSLVRLKRTTGNAGDFTMQIGGSNPGVIFDAVGISSDFIFQTQGTEIMRLDSLNRKVGIGTDIPADKLSIHSAPNSLVLGAKDTTRGNHIFQILADDSAGNGELRLYKNSGSGTHEKTVEIASSGDSYFLQGSIGVGEETPDSKLDILHSSSTNPDTENLIHLRTDPGAGYVSRGLFIKIGRDLNYDNSGAYYDIVGSSGNSGFHAFQVQGNDILRINKDGNVGIGSTSPNLLNEPSKFRELTIGGRTEGAAIHLKDDNNNVQAGFFTSDNTGAMIIRTITNHPLMFRTNNSERLRITNEGKVGISSGTIDPENNQLLIRGASTVGTKNGHIMLTGDGATIDEGPQIVFSESGSGSNYAGGSIGFHRKGSNSIGDLVFGTRESSGGPDTTTTERLRIKSNGKVGIGTDDPNMTLHVKSTSDDVARFQSTNGTNGTAITLDHIGGSPADDDIIGKIVFNGQDDGYNSTTYADIKCITSDVSNGTETAHLDFSTRGLGSFAAVFRINRRSTASAPSYTTDDADGVILDVYNTGNPYPRYMNFIAKSAGNTDSNIGFWTEKVGGSPTEKLRIAAAGDVETKGLSQFNFNSDWGAYARNVVVFPCNDTSKWFSFVGTGLRFTDGGNFVKPSDDGSTNWGNIAGMVFEGVNNNTDSAIRFVVDQPSGNGTNYSLGSGDAGKAAAIDNNTAMSILGNGQVGINTNNHMNGRVTIRNTNGFNSSSISANTDNIYLISNTTSSDGAYGASIGFSRVQYPDRRAAAITTVQNGTDEDKVGLSFWTHDNTDATANIVEKLRISATGVVHHSNDVDEMTWSRQTGRAQQGNANATTYTIKTFYYGIATFKIALSDGNNKWAHFVVEIGGMQYSVSNGYNATIVANSTGNGPSISTNQQDGGYHITITNGGNSNTLFGSWVLEGTSYTNLSKPTLVLS